MWRRFMNAILTGMASTAPALAAEAGGLAVLDFNQDNATEPGACTTGAGEMAEPGSPSKENYREANFL